MTSAVQCHAISMIFKKSQGTPGRLALLEGCDKPNLIPIQKINIKYPIVWISKQGGKTPKLKVLQWKLSLEISCLVLFSCLVKEDIQTGNSNQSLCRLSQGTVVKRWSVCYVSPCKNPWNRAFCEEKQCSSFVFHSAWLSARMCGIDTTVTRNGIDFEAAYLSKYWL